MRFFPLCLCFLSLFASVAHAQTASKTFNFADPKTAPIAVPYSAPGGVAAQVDVKIERGALQFLNRAGGSFGVCFNVTPFDANEFSSLVFDYARSDDAKVNWFFKVNGSYYGVVFSGPSRVRPGSFLLGTLPNVGQKGRATIPLRDWLRRFQPRAEKLMVEEILVGNWDNEGYLLAGIGGNGPGANWSLRSFSLITAPAKTPLQMGKPSFDGNDIVWPLEGGELDTKTAIFGIDSQKWDFTSPFLRLEASFDAQNALSRRLVFSAGDALQRFKDGQILDLTLENQTARLAFDSGSHAGDVPLPQLEWENVAAPVADFETDNGNWSGKNAILERDSQNPFSGKNSGRFSNPRTASSFDAALGNGFDAAKFPVLTFAYRADARLRLDFRLGWEGKPYSIGFFDRDAKAPRLGTIADVTADEKWHLAQIPLLDWMKKARPDATNFQVESFGVADDGWLGNARGVQWHLDEFRAAPLIKEVLRTQVSARDISGIKAVSYSLDQVADTQPDRAPEGGPKLEIPLGEREKGVWWLHVRAQNEAGKWSDTAHFPFVIGTN